MLPSTNDAGALPERHTCRNCGRDIVGKRAASAVLCPGCRSDDAIPDATTRKVLNRGRAPVAYQTPSHGWRYGWIVRELPGGAILVRFPTDATNTRIAGTDLRHLRAL